MGRSADNERLRLKATFYNNLAVGAAVAGLLAPFIALYPKLLANERMTLEGLLAVMTPEVIFSMLAAGCVTYILRSRANAAISQLEDDD